MILFLERRLSLFNLASFSPKLGEEGEKFGLDSRTLSKTLSNAGDLLDNEVSLTSMRQAGNEEQVDPGDKELYQYVQIPTSRMSHEVRNFVYRHGWYCFSSTHIGLRLARPSNLSQLSNLASNFRGSSQKPFTSPFLWT